jgi:hypothetical protein
MVVKTELDRVLEMPDEEWSVYSVGFGDKEYSKIKQDLEEREDERRARAHDELNDTIKENEETLAELVRRFGPGSPAIELEILTGNDDGQDVRRRKKC